MPACLSLQALQIRHYCGRALAVLCGCAGPARASSDLTSSGLASAGRGAQELDDVELDDSARSSARKVAERSDRGRGCNVDGLPPAGFLERSFPPLPRLRSLFEARRLVTGAFLSLA